MKNSGLILVLLQMMQTLYFSGFCSVFSNSEWRKKKGNFFPLDFVFNAPCIAAGARGTLPCTVDLYNGDETSAF